MKLLPILSSLGATAILSVTAYPAPSPTASSAACPPTEAADSYGPNRRSPQAHKDSDGTQPPCICNCDSRKRGSQAFPPMFLDPEDKRSNDAIENNPQGDPNPYAEGELSDDSFSRNRRSPQAHKDSDGTQPPCIGNCDSRKRGSQAFPPMFLDPEDKRSNDAIKNNPQEDPPPYDGELSGDLHGPERRSPQETTLSTAPKVKPPVFHEGEAKRSNDQRRDFSEGMDGDSKVPQPAPGGPSLADTNAAQQNPRIH